jgi:hypothetical protein
VRCTFVFDVEFERDGQAESIVIEKEFDLDFRPMVDDECTVCGDWPFGVTEFSFDADDGEARVYFNRGPTVGSVQRWVDQGFRLLNTGTEPPEGINWGGSQ